MKTVVILEGARTPIGSFLGSLISLSATSLGGIAIKGALERSQIEPSDVDEVLMGQVLQGGAGQAPARQASMLANIPTKVPCTTINKVCGSGLKAIMLGANTISLNEANIVVAGGMESMSNAPYFIEKCRQGFKAGNQKLMDLMIHDGLFDPYDKSHMGNFGDICASVYNFSRAEQDDFAIKSYEKALSAQSMGHFDNEIVEVKIKHKNGEDIIKKDEEPQNYKPQKISKLNPAFSLDGTVTAANASKINDGAAALVICAEDEAKKRKIIPKARIVAQVSHAEEPKWFTKAPILAIKKVADKAQLRVSDIGLFEINEAFSVVPMLAIRELSLNPSLVNIFGGAVSLGHPIGSSGARILLTLINAMHIYNVRFGCVAICLGGGEAVSMIVEKVNA